MRPQFTNLILKFYSTQSGNEAPVMLFRRDKMELLSNQSKPYCRRAPFMGVKKCYNYLFLPDVEKIFVNDVRSLAVRFAAATRLEIGFEMHTIEDELTNAQLIDKAHELFETPPAKPSNPAKPATKQAPAKPATTPDKSKIEYVTAYADLSRIRRR